MSTPLTTEHDKTHPMVYLGEFSGEHGGTYPVRWCRQCGTVVMFMGAMASTLVPELFKKFEDRKMEMVKDKPRYTKAKPSVLGRGLKDMMDNAPALGKSMAALLGGTDVRTKAR